MRARSATRGTLARFCRIAMLGLSLTMGACDQDSGEQAVSLVDWSPDRSRAALVPNFMKDDPVVSGIWVYDFKAGSTTHIFTAPEGAVCTHPQWSPAGDELLFGMVLNPEDNSSERDDSIAFSVYAIRSDGQALRRLADSQSASPENFVMRNAISWGPTSGTILFQQSAGNRVTAMQLDLASGELRQYLPDSSDSYSLEPSPDRRHVAAILYYKESDSARLYLADFAATAWSFVETLEVDADRMKTHSQLIYWSPDSTEFLVREKARAAAGEKPAGGYLRLFDVIAGSSRRFPAGEPSPVILWNRDSSALVFAGTAGSAAGIYRADLSSGNVSLIVPGSENHLLSWNHQDGRIYFFRTRQTHASQPVDIEEFEHRLFSCDTEGTGGRTLGRFYTSGKPYWNLSPDGNQMMLFEDAEAPDLLYLATGGADRIRFQDGMIWP